MNDYTSVGPDAGPPVGPGVLPSAATPVEPPATVGRAPDPWAAVTRDARADGVPADDAVPDDAVSDGVVSDGAVPDDAAAGGVVPDGAMSDGAVSDGVVPDGTGAGDTVAGDTGAGAGESAAEDPATGADAAALDDPGRLAAAVEAVLFVVDTPVTAADLAEVFGVSGPRMDEVLGGLRDDYDRQARGFTLREVAGGWRLYTREEYAPYVERYVLDGQQTRLTQAALETLAVVAYRQPVTRSRIAAIRGVGVDGVMRTLLTRGLVEECGTDPNTGGNLYRTTSLFLEKLGLRSLDELPSLAPLLPEIDAVDDVATST